MPERGGPACDESGRNALLVARAELLIKVAATSLHLPPASIASTTRGSISCSRVVLCSFFASAGIL